MIAQNAEQHRTEYRIGPGASTLLMIFVSLCMATVSILALISAMADTRLTDRAQMHIEAYYAAAERVQRELSVIDEDLAGNRAFAEDLSDYRELVLGMVNDQIDLYVEPNEDDGDSLLLSFSVEMYEGHEVFVLLDVPVSLSGPRYHILSHVMRNTGEWQPDDSIELFDVGQPDGGIELPGPEQSDGDVELSDPERFDE